VDIEHVLWGLDRLLQALSEFTADDRFGSQLLRLAQISIIADNYPPPGQQTYAQFNLLEAKATALKNAINERIYDFFATQPNEGELDRSWVPLLRWAAGAGFNRIDLVTTNYDLVLEYAMERVGQTLRVEEGWKRRVSETTLDLNRWDSSNASEAGLLTKLHGSVDWYRSGTSASPVIRVGHPDFDGDHKKRSIIYPGFKGRPSDVPFIAFHEYFRRRVSVVSHMLFIGFAFRDDYINDLLATATPSTSEIAIVDPRRPNTKPFSQQPVYIEQYFGEAPSPITVPTTPNLVNEVKDWAEGIRKARAST
jgi:SIR2-like domain